MLPILIYLGITTLLVAFCTAPLVRSLAIRYNFIDQPDTDRKFHAVAVPRVGGVAIWIAYSLAMLTAIRLPLGFEKYWHPGTADINLLIVAIAIVFFAGLLDDLFGLKPLQKLLLIVLASFVAVKAGVTVELLGMQWAHWFSVPITVLWLVWCANAFNLIDGMDGLATGIGLLASCTMLIAGLTTGNNSLTLLILPLIGALTGFIRYNIHPASMFLGDSGSLSIGFMLGCFGAIWSHKAATILGLAAPILAMAVPFADVMLAIARRFLSNQPIFQGDAKHIHHRLLNRGLTVRGAAALLYGVCLVGSIAALSVSAFQQQRWGGVILAGFGILVWIAIQELKYAEFSIAGRMLFTGDFRRYVDAHTRFAEFADHLERASTVEDCWKVIRKMVPQFSFLGARMQIGGKVYEDLPANLAEIKHWQMRIPLPNNQHANFYRTYRDEVSPLLINQFVMTVESKLRTMLDQQEPATARVRTEITRRTPTTTTGKKSAPTPTSV